MLSNVLKKLKIPGKLIYLSQYGSHLYGLNTENSDLDFRGVYIPNLDDVILGKAQDEINEELEITYQPPQPTSADGMCALTVYIKPRTVKVDVKTFSLQKFIKLCSKADTNALDLLFSASLLPKSPNYQPNIQQYYNGYTKGMFTISYILKNKDKLINTGKLESPITYAFKQAEKYSIKGFRYKVLKELLVITNRLLYNDNCIPISENKYLQIKDCIKEFEYLIDGKHVKIDELDNKGTKEKYLFVCGVQHQFNLEIVKFKERLEEKINKEYTSQRTKDAADGNDWKALSHAIRILLEVKQLLEDGTITFPCIENTFLLRIKQGKISREVIDEFFNKELSNVLEKVQSNELNWSYDEEFWNRFILEEIKQCQDGV